MRDFGWGISGVAFSVRDFGVEILVSGLWRRDLGSGVLGERF